MRLLILACTIFFVAPIDAADAPANVKDAEWHKLLNDQFGKGTKRALLIGIDEYKPPLDPLGACINDIHLLEEVLNKFCGYERNNIHVLKNKDATKANVLAKLKEILLDSNQADSIFVSYGGHGTLIDGQSYLCVYDMNVDKAKETALSADLIRDMMHVRKMAQKILYIDSCHSGGAQGAKNKITTTNQELAGPFEKASGLITFAGCRRSQSCIDYLKHGVFTLQFARGLAGAADFDKNGIVDSDEIYRHLLLEVPATALLVDPKHEQIPVRIIGEDVVGVFALSKVDGKDQVLLGKLPARPKAGDTLENSIGMKFIFLPSGPLVIGSPRTEYLRNDDEAQQYIILNKPMFMGIHEVTQDSYLKVMGKNPSYYSTEGSGSDAVTGMKTGSFPVEQVSWSDAVAFCEKLSNLPEEKKARRAYRLPSECEWEFACRAGTTTVFSTGNRISSKQANIKGDKTYLDSDEGPTLGRTAPVGSYKPNAFGLYDMHGNVAEWCQDFYTMRPFLTMAAYAPENSEKAFENLTKLFAVMDGPKEKKSFVEPLNPTGPSEGESRVYRGGAFSGDVTFTRCAARRDKADDYTYRAIGFRVVCYPAGN